MQPDQATLEGGDKLEYDTDTHTKQTTNVTFEHHIETGPHQDSSRVATIKIAGEKENREEKGGKEKKGEKREKGDKGEKGEI